jgi:TetR/AcrR family transcriptional regulator, transcriptional repressor for nem operon
LIFSACQARTSADASRVTGDVASLIVSGFWGVAMLANMADSLLPVHSAPALVPVPIFWLADIPTNRYVVSMARPTKYEPERGDARTRLLEAARDTIRAKGYAATSVDDLCRVAGVTKGSFFHHFKSKEALGVAAAKHWTETTTAFFAAAPYHAPRDPLERVLAYVAFRKSIIVGEVAEFCCLVGTMAQEVYASWPAIREACADSIFGHAATLEADIRDAIRQRGIAGDWTAESLARHTQTVIQGAFVLAKAANDPALARESLDHLDRYIRLLFGHHDKHNGLQ